MAEDIQDNNEQNVATPVQEENGLFAGAEDIRDGSFQPGGKAVPVGAAFRAEVNAFRNRQFPACKSSGQGMFCNGALLHQLPCLDGRGRGSHDKGDSERPAPLHGDLPGMVAGGGA